MTDKQLVKRHLKNLEKIYKQVGKVEALHRDLSISLERIMGDLDAQLDQLEVEEPVKKPPKEKKS